ncbi:MAG: hypothetical protein AAFX54_15045 [Pseudomonadota bacterium]
MKKRTAIIAGAMTALLSSAAFGGAVQPFPVEVDLVNLTANGDMVTARYSDNKVELIGCGIRKIEDGAGGVFSFGFCQARDADDVRGFCNTQNADLLDAIYASADYGFITFSWNEDGQCTRIGFSNQSFYLPKGLDSNN